MNFYQDDNALVFKFTHLNEPAGNLGVGIFGQGAYRYTLTPYLPIFYLFGYNPVPYYILDLIFIVLSVYIVYIFFLNLFEDKLKARVASLVYAAGYIGSDGMIRIFNSILTSLSVIFTCATIGSYHRYYRTKKFKWYLLSLLAFYLASDVGFIRTHYLVVVVIAFEVIFFLSHKYKSVKGFIVGSLKSIFRMSPFIFLFYKVIFQNLDARSSQGIEFLKSLTNGEFYKTYSFFTTLGNMILSNQIFPAIFAFIQKSFHLVIIPKHIIFLSLVLITLLIIYFHGKKLVSKWYAAVFLLISFFIFLVSRKIFSSYELISNTNAMISLYAGVFFSLLSLLFIRILPNKKYSVVLLIWLASNLSLYSIYLPTSPLLSDDRYLTHSFLPLTGLVALLSVNFYRKIKSNLKIILLLFVFLWGAVNLFSAVNWHSEIITERSNPSKRFFSQLKNYYPSIPKKSVLYFYIPDKPNAHLHYDSGFGVGQMPDETAIAWRYGIDRYDLTIVNTFSDLKKQIAIKNTPIGNIFTFIADPDNLINTTDKSRELLKDGIVTEKIVNQYLDPKLDIYSSKTVFSLNPLILNFKDIYSLTDFNLSLRLKGEPIKLDNIVFPLTKQGFNKPFSNETIYLASTYLRWKEEYIHSTVVSVSSTWQDKSFEFAIDNNPETFWQGDRIEWPKNSASMTLALNDLIDVSGIYYRNGPSSLAPTKFEILVSTDGENFQKVSLVTRSYTDGESYAESQKIVFDKKQAKYIKLNFLETQSNDSPAISEIEVIPEKFRNLNYEELSEFLVSPFNFVDSLNDWELLVNQFSNTGSIKVEWETDGSNKLLSTIDSTVSLTYDENFHDININVPADGQYFKKIIISPIGIPGKLTLESIRFYNPPMSKMTP